MNRAGTGLPHGTRGASRTGNRRLAPAVPWVLAAAVVGSQVAYPLVTGDARARLTVVTVVLFFAASVTHAAVSRGVAWAGALAAVAVGVGFAAEAVGVRTGFPFGAYRYTGSLGPAVAGVPVVIPLAWAMMAYPALLVGRRLARPRLGWWAVAPVGGWALASWDVFLDPQMVDAGHWRWLDPTPALPGVPGVPLSNFAGWLLVAALLMGLLHLVLPDNAGRPEGVPALLYLWTFGSSVLAHAVFFDSPGVALTGAVAMGAVAVPYAYRLWRRQR